MSAPGKGEYDEQTLAGRWKIRWEWKQWPASPGAMLAFVGARRIAEARRAGMGWEISYTIPARVGMMPIGSRDSLRGVQHSVGEEWEKFIADIGALRGEKAAI